MGAR
ncbi:fc5507ca-08ca-4436-bc1f-57d7d5d98eb6 [Thermothielavioides terrestris]|jgi:apoptosis-inducing factor 2